MCCFALVDLHGGVLRCVVLHGCVSLCIEACCVTYCTCVLFYGVLFCVIQWFALICVVLSCVTLSCFVSCCCTSLRIVSFCFVLRCVVSYIGSCCLLCDVLHLWLH